MDNKLNDFLKFPAVLEPSIQMSFQNESILLQTCQVTFTNGSGQIELNGRLMFNWLPSMTVKFYGSFPKDSPLKDFQFFDGKPRLKIENNSEVFEINGLSESLNEPNNSIDIVCQLAPPIVFGNIVKKVNKVVFEIPNLRGFIGNPVKTNNTVTKNRLLFNNGEYEILIDKSIRFREISDQLSNFGGYQLVYSGQLKSVTTEAFSFSESEIILEQFAYFLQFINGSRSSALFRSGYLGESEVWKSYTPYEADIYKNVLSWAKTSSTSNFNDLWINFSSKWKVKKDRECLKTILHWYIEANRNSTKLEGSIVLIQNALELLFHWIIGESENYVTASDAANISAAAKIGFLLALFKINPMIPERFDALKQFEKEYNILNGPELFINIRNSIVHPSEKKRKNLEKLDTIGRFQTLTLGLFYVEIILLKYLDYKGDYRNRVED